MVMSGVRSECPVVCTFESRRSDEMTSLIARHGGQAVSAPSMREIPIGDNPQAADYIRGMLQNQFSMTILMTGVGTESLFEVAQSLNLYEQLLDAMRRSLVVIRGPKPAAVLNKAGLRYDLKAPEPNTWRELLGVLDEAAVRNPALFGMKGKAVAVQEYGLPNPRFYQELETRGAQITPVPVYRWALPENLKPLQDAIQQIVSGHIDIVLFTSANQITNVLSVAAELQLLDELKSGLRDTLNVSIGPTCSEAMVDNGITVGYEASPPKMGPMVRGAIEQWRTGTNHFGGDDEPD